MVAIIIESGAIWEMEFGAELSVDVTLGYMWSNVFSRYTLTT